MKTLILSHSEIEAKIRRMAYQVHEENYLHTDGLVFVAMSERGTFLAKRLAAYLQSQFGIGASCLQVEVNRAPQMGMMPIIRGLEPEKFEGKNVVIVDDVLYSGRTLMSVAAQIIAFDPQKIECLVLVDRGHREMPIYPKFVGMELATTLQQHVSFELDGMEKAVVYLQ